LNRAHKLIGSFLSLLALGALVLVLNSLFQTRLTQIGVAPSPDTFSQDTGASSPDSGLADAWKNATLDTIQFGEPRVVLTHQGAVKIHTWLPDDRRLLLELEDPTVGEDVARHYRIVTLDVETGRIVEYGRREDSNNKPAWIDRTGQVAFTFAPLDTPPEIRLGSTGGEVRTIERSNALLAVQPSTGRLYYLRRELTGNPLRALNLSQRQAAVEMPSTSSQLPTGLPAIDPTSQFLAILWRTDLPLVNLGNGQVRTYSFANLPQSDLPWWAMDGIWSPNGQTLAMILGQDSDTGLLVASKLALFDRTSGKVRFVDLPAQFVMELSWDPSNRFILARGVPSGGSMADTNVFWLIDATRGAYKESSYFPATLFPRYPFMAWSRKGQLAWIRGSNNGPQIVITQISPGR